jgi:hypothetical protein
MSLACAKINFIEANSLKCGMSYRLPVSISSDEFAVSLENLINPVCHIKKFYDSTTVTYAPTVNVLNAVNGLIELAFDGTYTKLIPPGIYLYDVFFYNPSLQPIAFIEGKIQFVPSISL